MLCLTLSPSSLLVPYPKANNGLGNNRFSWFIEKGLERQNEIRVVLKPLDVKTILGSVGRAAAPQ